MMSEEKLTVERLDYLREVMRSQSFSFDQLSQAAGWSPGDLQSYLWDNDHDRLSIEVLRDLADVGRRFSVEDGNGIEPSLLLDDYDALFKPGYRGAPYNKAGSGAQAEKKVSPYWQFFNLVAFRLFKDTLEGHYPTDRLEPTLREFAEAVKKRENTEGQDFQPVTQ